MAEFYVDPSNLPSSNRFLSKVTEINSRAARKSPGRFISGPMPAETEGKQPKNPDDFSEDIRTYLNDPTPAAGDTLLARIGPVIDRAAQANLSKPSPVMLGRARLLAMESLPKYDSSTSLYTFLTGQLMPLRREAAASRTGVKVPRNLAQEKNTLKKISLELEDELGRSPSSSELADRAGISLEKLYKLNKLNLPQIAEREYESPDGNTSTASDFAAIYDNDLWRQAVYHDLNPVNQIIMEHSLGMFGKPRLTNQDIAKLLRISPSAVTQRKAVIQAKLNQVER